MSKGIRNAIFLWVFWSFNALAATDPVAWSLSPATGFPATTKIGEQSVVTYTFTSRLPFATPLVIISKITGSSFIIHDECHNKVLNPGKSCAVVVAFKPASTKVATFQLTYGYNKNRIPLPALSAKGVNPTPPPPTAHLTGTIIGLPPVFYQNTTVDFKSIYTNAGTTPLTDCAFGDFIRTGAAGPNPTTSAGVPPCTATINPGTSCQINGTLTSNTTATGLVTVSQTASCSGPVAVSVTPKASAIIKAPVNVCVVHGAVDLPLPNATYKYADNVVRFRFENECNQTVTLGPVSLSAEGGSATITRAPYSTSSSTLNNCGATLAAKDECFITASIIPTSVGNLTISASVAPPGKAVATAKTSTTVASNIQAQHHILFINQCKFPIWYGIANGGNNNCPGAGCQTQDPNLTTYPNGAPQSAYYLPAQVTGAAPATIDLATPSYQNGALWPRAGCTMQNGQFNCVTGTCQTKSGSATCEAPSLTVKGPEQPQSPYTKIEQNLVSTPGGDGVYDVSLENGMSVPVEYKGFGPSTGNTASTVYNCSAAGALIQPASNNRLGNCSWRFNPQSTLTSLSGINSDFYWMNPSSINDNCANGPRCGMSYNAYPAIGGTVAPGNSTSPINRHMGDFVAYNPLLNDTAYSANAQWGSQLHNLFVNYGMGQVIDGQTSSNNYGTYLIKTGKSILLPGYTQAAYNVLLSIPGVTNTGALDSCYQVGNTNFSHCGGCINWSNTLPAAPCGYGNQAYQPGMNEDWTTNLINAPVGSYTPLQAIQWVKDACPTIYSYQYDDQASSFQCNKDNGTPLLTSYQITFCPGGEDSLPTGATEGRATAPH